MCRGRGGNLGQPQGALQSLQEHVWYHAIASIGLLPLYCIYGNEMCGIYIPIIYNLYLLLHTGSSIVAAFQHITVDPYVYYTVGGGGVPSFICLKAS